MSLHELQRAVTQLGPSELATFVGWFENHLADRWDCQIEADALAGRLNDAMQRADDDFDAGRCTDLF